MIHDGVSVVTTTWNERKNVEKLVVEIRKALHGYPHEIIVVDDSSADGTIEVAKRFADVAVTKPREGQSKGLLYGMRLAKYPVIVTIDADLENDPKYIPRLLQQICRFDVVVASRTEIHGFQKKLLQKLWVNWLVWRIRFQILGLTEEKSFQCSVLEAEKRLVPSFW